MQSRLHYKYEVVKHRRDECEEGGISAVDVDSPFVLMPGKDPAAMVALKAYAENCEPELAREIREWIGEIEAAPRTLGTQGKRNERFLRMRDAKINEELKAAKAMIRVEWNHMKKCERVIDLVEAAKRLERLEIEAEIYQKTLGFCRKVQPEGQ